MSIQFWMPDGQAPEKDVSGTSDFRPDEKGRGIAKPNAAVITFNKIAFYEVAPPNNENPDRLINNLLTFLGPRRIQPQGDLLGILPLPPAIEVREWFRQSEKESVLFTCLGEGGEHLCQTYLNLKDEHLIVFAVTPARLLEQNQEAITILRDLLKKWQIEFRP